MLKIIIHSHLEKINFALKCIPEAVLDGLLLLGVALKATLGFYSNLVFWGPLTSPNTWKVVSFMEEFLPFSATTYGLTVKELAEAQTKCKAIKLIKEGKHPPHLQLEDITFS